MHAMWGKDNSKGAKQRRKQMHRKSQINQNDTEKMFLRKLFMISNCYWSVIPKEVRTK